VFHAVVSRYIKVFPFLHASGTLAWRVYYHNAWFTPSQLHQNIIGTGRDPVRKAHIENGIICILVGQHSERWKCTCQLSRPIQRWRQNGVSPSPQSACTCDPSRFAVDIRRICGKFTAVRFAVGLLRLLRDHLQYRWSRPWSCHSTCLHIGLLSAAVDQDVWMHDSVVPMKRCNVLLFHDWLTNWVCVSVSAELDRRRKCWGYRSRLSDQQDVVDVDTSPNGRSTSTMVGSFV